MASDSRTRASDADRDRTAAALSDAAERLLEAAESHPEPDTRAKWCVELARMYLAMSMSQVSRAASTAPDVLPGTPRGGPRTPWPPSQAPVLVGPQ